MSEPSTSRRSRMNRKRAVGLATESAMATIGEYGPLVAARSFVLAGEKAPGGVAHRERMPLAGPDPLFRDVRRRKFRCDHFLGVETFQHPVDDPLGAEILRAVDAELKFRERGVLDHVLGQEIFRAEAEITAVAGDDVHRRRADEGGDKTVGGVIVDFRRRSHLAHLTVVDDGDAVAHAHGFDLVVGDVDGGDADALLELLDLLARGGAQFGIEVRQRLVEQQRGRLAHQRPGERDPLAFTARELPRPTVKQMTDAEQLRGPFDLFADLRARRALRLQRKGDVVATREMRIEPVALKHHRHAAGARRDVVDDGAADEKVAAGLLLEPADDAQKRGLAAARWPEQNHEFAVRYVKRNAVYSGDLAEFLDDVPGDDRSHSASQNLT